MDVFVLDRKLVCAVTLPNQGQTRAFWSVSDLDNKVLAGGWSDGMKKSGAGSIPIAMENAKRAARRILRKQEHPTENVARQAGKDLRESRKG
jgi:hypothetical protein